MSQRPDSATSQAAALTFDLCCSGGGRGLGGALSPQGSLDGGLGSDVEESMVQAFRVQDLMDVQVMARLQEESESEHQRHQRVAASVY